MGLVFIIIFLNTLFNLFEVNPKNKSGDVVRSLY